MSPNAIIRTVSVQAMDTENDVSQHLTHINVHTSNVHTYIPRNSSRDRSPCCPISCFVLGRSAASAIRAAYYCFET